MIILLTGSKGMLAAGVKLLKPADVTLIETDVEELDITNARAVQAFCEESAPHLILNCAAYTAVDNAETDKETAFAVNTVGPKNLAETAAARGIPFVHVSTDYVFFGDGSHPLREDDACAPRGVYAESKRAGEIAIEQAGGQWLTVRTSWLYGPRGKNFPDTMLRLAREKDRLTVVNDQIGSPTFSRDLAEALWTLIKVNAAGYYHFSNTGACTWYEFAVEAVRQAKEMRLFPKEREVEFVPVTSDKFPRPAPRPAYSVMATEKYAKTVGAPPRAWQDALRAFLGTRKDITRPQSA